MKIYDKKPSNLSEGKRRSVLSSRYNFSSRRARHGEGDSERLVSGRCPLPLGGCFSPCRVLNSSDKETERRELFKRTVPEIQVAQKRG